MNSFWLLDNHPPFLTFGIENVKAMAKVKMEYHVLGLAFDLYMFHEIDYSL